MDINRVSFWKGKPFVLIQGKKGLDRQYGIISKCVICGKRIFTPKYRIITTGNVCSGKCAGKKYAGNKSPKWHGGRLYLTNGYIEVTLPKNHPLRKKGERYIPEHRLVMERHLERYLKPKEFIHHLNGNKTDNRLENLALCSKQTHFDFIKKLQERIRELEKRKK